MSLEKSMELLAESNTKLAEAQSKLAEAQQAVAAKYDEMIAFVAGQGGAKEAPEKEAPEKEEKKAPAKKAAKRGRPKKEEKEEDDGFGEGDEQEEITFDQVKAQLLAVRDAHGGDKAPAVALLKDHGYRAIPEIQEKDYRSIYDAAQKLIDDAL